MSGLNALVQRLERFGAAETKQRIAEKVRDVMHQECIRGFNEKRDPYGTPWDQRKPIKAEFALRFGLLQDKHPLLDKTGKMINSLRSIVVGGNRVAMRILGYAKYHQFGTGQMVARKMFPDPAQGLGTWSEPVHQAAVNAVKEMMH